MLTVSEENSTDMLTLGFPDMTRVTYDLSLRNTFAKDWREPSHIGCSLRSITKLPGFSIFKSITWWLHSFSECFTFLQGCVRLSPVASKTHLRLIRANDGHKGQYTPYFSISQSAQAHMGQESQGAVSIRESWEGTFQKRFIWVNTLLTHNESYRSAGKFSLRGIAEKERLFSASYTS